MSEYDSSQSVATNRESRTSDDNLGHGSVDALVRLVSDHVGINAIRSDFREEELEAGPWQVSRDIVQGSPRIRILGSVHHPYDIQSDPR